MTEAAVNMTPLEGESPSTPCPSPWDELHHEIMRTPVPAILESLLQGRHECSIYLPDTKITYRVIRREEGYRLAMTRPDPRIDCLVALDGEGKVMPLVHADFGDDDGTSTGSAVKEESQEMSLEEFAETMKRTLLSIFVNPLAEKYYPPNPIAALFPEETTAAAKALEAWYAWEDVSRARWKESNIEGYRCPPPPFPREIIPALRPLFLANGIDLIPCQSQYDRIAEYSESFGYSWGNSHEAEQAGPYYKLEVIRPGAGYPLCARLELFKKRYPDHHVFLAPEELLKEQSNALFSHTKGVALGINDIVDVLAPGMLPFMSFRHELRHAREASRKSEGRVGFFSGQQSGFMEGEAQEGYYAEMSFDEILAFRDNASRSIRHMGCLDDVREPFGQLFRNISFLNQTAGILKASAERALSMSTAWTLPAMVSSALAETFSGGMWLVKEQLMFSWRRWTRDDDGYLEVSVCENVQSRLVVDLPDNILDPHRLYPDVLRLPTAIKERMKLIKATKTRLEELRETGARIETGSKDILESLRAAHGKIDSSGHLPPEILEPIIEQTKNLCAWIKHKHDLPE